jgi:hypothetical protein
VTFERVIRTGRVTGVKADSVLTAVLLSELVSPSATLWLVSPWISDISAIDNSGGGFDSVFVDAASRMYTLSEVLALLTRTGTRLSVVTRPDPHNLAFLERLDRLADPAKLSVIRHEDVHEKTFCGDRWILSGSMNFTVRGMQVNDEATTYKVSVEAAAAARLDFRHRFGAQL